jgi:hypothetical protein
MHAVLIWEAQAPGPPSAACCAGPSRQVMHAWVGLVCVAAQMFERHSLPQGPGAAVVPQAHVRSAFAHVSKPVFEPVESSGGWLSQQSWQSCAAPASPGAFAQLAVVPPLLLPLLLPLLELPLLEPLPLLPLFEPLPLLPLLEPLPLLPLFEPLLLLPLLEPLLLLPPASLLKPGVVAVLEQPLV